MLLKAAAITHKSFRSEIVLSGKLSNRGNLIFKHPKCFSIGPLLLLDIFVADNLVRGRRRGLISEGHDHDPGRKLCWVLPISLLPLLDIILSKIISSVAQNAHHVLFCIKLARRVKTAQACELFDQGRIILYPVLFRQIQVEEFMLAQVLLPRKPGRRKATQLESIGMRLEGAAGVGEFERLR